jgi:hypothetical protein
MNGVQSQPSCLVKTVSIYLHMLKITVSTIYSLDLQLKGQCDNTVECIIK